VLFLGFLFVVLIPLVEGVLLALVLREVHIRHPLPLGGSLTPPKPREIRVADMAEIQETPATEDIVDGENVEEKEGAQLDTSPDLADDKLLSSITSVFDEATNIQENFPVSDILNAMIAGAPAGVPDDFEHRIEETAHARSDVRNINNDMDADDLDALAAALPPREKIDFTQELEENSEVPDAISPMAKELLGENFDFDALEEQAKESFKSLAPINDTDKEDASEVTFDVQEDEAGIIQVSSPFIVDVTPQLADFAEPQTVLPMFSSDWIQETESIVESLEGDVSQFCFTEESRPMFVRKGKAVSVGT